MGKGQVTFGGALSLAVGPVGRDIAGNVGLSDTKEISAAYSYSRAKGAYVCYFCFIFSLLFISSIVHVSKIRFT